MNRQEKRGKIPRFFVFSKGEKRQLNCSAKTKKRRFYLRFLFLLTYRRHRKRHHRRVQKRGKRGDELDMEPDAEMVV